jgi:hypothetical protein
MQLINGDNLSKLLEIIEQLAEKYFNDNYVNLNGRNEDILIGYMQGVKTVCEMIKEVIG